MSDTPAQEAQLVHELRKTIKRMRALGRLLRYQLREDRGAPADDGALRAAGRRLAGERDAQVRLNTLEELIERYPKALDRSGVRAVHARLRSELTTRALVENRAVPSDVRAMRATLRDWRELELRTEALRRGLRRIYKQGRTRYRRACEGDPSSAELHDWRKRVKHLQYALEALHPTEGHPRKLARRAKRLGELLGSEHDLWMLSEYLERHSDAFARDERGRKRLAQRIERRRRRLRKRALELGEKVYGAAPKDLFEVLDA